MTDDLHASRPDERQLQELIDEARSALDVIELGRERSVDKAAAISATQLIRRARGRTRDGYRGSNLEGGAPSSVLDDEGKPMPPVNDPTGELVAGERQEDPIRKLARQVARGLDAAVVDLLSVVSALVQATPGKVTENVEPGCRNHQIRIDSFEPVYRDGRCRWCYDWWLAHGDDAPTEILEARARGERITTKFVEQVMRPRHVKRRSDSARR